MCKNIVQFVHKESRGLIVIIESSMHAIFNYRVPLTDIWSCDGKGINVN